MLSVADRHLAQELATHHAVIIKAERADAYPAYAKGDRRMASKSVSSLSTPWRPGFPQKAGMKKPRSAG